MPGFGGGGGPRVVGSVGGVQAVAKNGHYVIEVAGAKWIEWVIFLKSGQGTRPDAIGGRDPRTYGRVAGNNPTVFAATTPGSAIRFDAGGVNQQIEFTAIGFA